jgi:ADP-ribose pyrophosphatase
LTAGELSARPWTRLSRRGVYDNPWISVVEDRVELPNGHQTIYGVVRCGDCVGVLPFIDDDHVVLVQQYRYVAGLTTWEMPTGGVAAGESLVAAAQRELSEEVGYRAGQLTPLTSFHTSKSVVEETAHLYVAHHLEPATVDPDDTELLTIERWPFEQVVGMVTAGQITDSMTVVAVLLADRQRRLRDAPRGGPARPGMAP